MEIIFDNTFWPLLLLGGLILGLGIAAILYYRNREVADLNLNQRLILAVLRITAFAAIATLLAGPLVKSLRRFVQDPVLIVGIDNSMSITALDDQTYTADFVNNLMDRINEQYADKFRVAFYTFGEQVSSSGLVDYSERNSDYGEFLDVVYNNHFNEHVGGLLLVGDGIVNRGVNPLGRVQQLNYPVYAIGLGDTTAYLDIGIADIRVNRNVFLNNRFSVELDIAYQGMSNQQIFSTIYSENQRLFEHTRLVNGDGIITVQALITASEAGLMNLLAEVDIVPGEKNRTNNQRSFVVNVIENKQKILIIANGMHPDIGAIQDVLNDQAAFEVTVITQEPFPTDITGNSLIIVHQLPSISNSMQTLFETAAKARTPLWIIVGNKSYLPQLNQLIPGVEIVPQANINEEAQAVLSPLFTQFTYSEELTELLNRFPPLKVPFARYTLSPDWSVQSTQRLINIETDRPLMAFSNRNGFKMGMLMGEGIWRWRLYNFYLRENHNAFREFVLKTTQYLALRDNEDNFMIDFKPVYEETESVMFLAEVYNEAFEAVTSADVRLVLINNEDQEFSYVFDQTASGYKLDAGRFPPGQYRFDAEVQLGETLYKEAGIFAVMPVNAEQMSLQANHRLLYQLANASGGLFMPAHDTEALINLLGTELQPAPFSYLVSVVDEVLNLRWIFFMILLLLSVEWFLRKFWGIY